jgi:acetylornithine deacetylase/succinyl-diaminopimelate desuccinylase-like protein
MASNLASNFPASNFPDASSAFQSTDDSVVDFAVQSIIQKTVARTWTADVVPTLCDYIAIPALSPMFSPDWSQTNHLLAAVVLLKDWAAARKIVGLQVEVHSLPNRTPVIVCEVAAFGMGKTPSFMKRSTDHAVEGGGVEGGAVEGGVVAGAVVDTVLLYGHLDKQPEMTGWRSDLGPWIPVLEGDRLYGRGGADYGYALFSALSAIEAVQNSGGQHHRCVVIIEASEESGSPDLPAHIEALAARIGTPSLVVCLDSGCLDYDRLWATTSLRGLAGGVLRVDVLSEGVHSGSASGVVPSSFRVIRELLDRVEDSRTGAVLIDACHVPIPEHRLMEAQRTASEIAPAASEFPFLPEVRPMNRDSLEQILNRTWRPTLSVTGADGLPGIGRAGNVLRPFTSLRLSFRLPPTVESETALSAIRSALTNDPPSGAHVELLAGEAADGWHAREFAPWLDRAMQRASAASFGMGYRSFGEGGTIPFMRMLQVRFPTAQFFVTGVLGPHSNAHGPNEFLHLPTAQRVTRCVAHVLIEHATNR